MPKVRVLTRLDGGISVVHPAPKSKKPSETEAEWLTRVLNKANPDGLVFKDIEKTALPTTRRFRDEWVEDASGAKVDLVKAKDKVKKELRKVRDEELKKSDGDMAKENEIGDAVSQKVVKDYRKSLRDLPANNLSIDAALDSDALELAYPNELTIDEYLAKS